MRKIAVFASGTGSNFAAILDAIKCGKISAEVALLVCDKPGAAVIEKADNHGVPTLVLQPKTFASKKEYEAAILKELKKRNVSFLVLAGYMRLIGPTLLREFSGRIVNIHPSLLPAFPGLHAIEQAFRAGVKVTGVTIHFVDEGMDTGPILAQQPVAIEEGDTIDAVAARIHTIEHVLYPETIAKLISEDIKERVNHDKTCTY